MVQRIEMYFKNQIQIDHLGSSTDIPKYTKLNPLDGIIDVGEGVNETDALIGKVMVSGLSQKKTKQDTVYRDGSTLWQSFGTW